MFNNVLWPSLLLSVVLLPACTQGLAPIDEERFVALAAEILIARENGYAQLQLDSLLTAYHTTQVEFDSSTARYARDPERLKILLEKISKKIGEK